MFGAFCFLWIKFFIHIFIETSSYGSENMQNTNIYYSLNLVNLMNTLHNFRRLLHVPNWRTFVFPKKSKAIKLLGICMLFGSAQMSYADQVTNNVYNYMIAANLAGQQKSISGSVSDKTGVAIIGASIVVKGTTNGTTTDFDGKFSLSNIKEDAILVISYVGMKPQELSVGNKTVFKVVLEDDAIVMDEVVAIGYVTRKKGELTGSVSTVKSEDIMRSSNSNVAKSLEGKVSGLIINDRGGYPGDNDMTMLIRGKATLNDNSPLIVIDGVPGGSLNNLAPSDIESITVLKDAAAAIYGARAANGVLLVTTARGKTGKPIVNINSSFKMSAFTRIPTMMNSAQYTTYMNEIADRNGNSLPYTAEDIAKYAAGNDLVNYPNTNWYDLTMKKYSNQYRNSVTVSGGSENVKYFVSGDMLNEGGMYKSGALNFNQNQLRSNLDIKLNKYLKLGVDISAVKGLRNEPGVNKSKIYKQLQVNLPISVAQYENGLYGVGSENGSNPLVMTTNASGFNKEQSDELKSRFTLDVDLGWLTEGLSLKATSSLTSRNTDTKDFKSTWTVYNYNKGTDTYDPVNGFDFNSGNYLSVADKHRKYNEDYYSGQLNYTRSFEDHTLRAFVAFEQVAGHWAEFEAYKRNLVSAEHPDLFAGETDGQTSTGVTEEWGRVNYFGSVSYDFKKKYLIDFTLRRDGSGNFASGKQFGTFPGASVGWVISKESFMQGASSWLNMFKLRASWALMGNDRIPGFEYLTKYSYGGYPALSGAFLANTNRNFYFFGENPTLTNSFYNSNVPNPIVTWEIADTKNIGFNFSVLNNKLSGDFNYFFQNRTNILTRREASIPDYAALQLPNENIGEVNSYGYELELSYKDKIGNVDFNLGGNLTIAKNNVVYLDEPANVPEWRKQEGRPIGSTVMYKTDGIFNDQAEVDNTVAKLAGTKPGDIKYVDVDGDDKITDNDMIRSDFSNIPEIQYGVFGGVSYKGFEINALVQGQAKAKLEILYDNEGNRPAYLSELRWTPENPNAEYPRAFGLSDTYNTKTSDFWMEDATFVRLKEVEIAYSFPKSIIPFANLKLMLKGTNLFTIDKLGKLKGFDPEMSRYRNFTDGLYQPLKTFTLGLNLQF